MAISQRFCTNHPERPAIGICVMTRKPICGECSTRYEGVNYSREGLKLLQRQRASAKPRKRKLLVPLLAWVVSPALLYLMYLGYMTTADALMRLLHGES
ncbi:MAG TPA: hypothetical protein VFC46_00575 [Humisphaera sp.]|nr:hypothetical protein [Humisphaera sp.]